MGWIACCYAVAPRSASDPLPVCFRRAREKAVSADEERDGVRPPDAEDEQATVVSPAPGRALDDAPPSDAADDQATVLSPAPGRALDDAPPSDPADDQATVVSPAPEDPLDEPTLPMSTQAGESADAAEVDPSEVDTTTLGAAMPPPVLVEEPEPASAPEREPEPASAPAPERESEPASASAPEREPEPASVSAPEREPGSVPESEPEPGPVGDAVPRGATTSTSIAPSSSLRPILLERVEPSLGRGERLRLDASHWTVVLGRAEESDIRLYTASASRQHAIIAGNEQGEWLLTPAEGRTVLIDGDRVTDPVVIEPGMNIVLGQDHLRCVTDGLDPRAATLPPVEEGSRDARSIAVGMLAGPRGLAGLAGAGVVLVAVLWWLLGWTGGGG